MSASALCWQPGRPRRRGGRGDEGVDGAGQPGERQVGLRGQAHAIEKLDGA